MLFWKYLKMLIRQSDSEANASEVWMYIVRLRTLLIFLMVPRCKIEKETCIKKIDVVIVLDGKFLNLRERVIR